MNDDTRYVVFAPSPFAGRAQGGESGHVAAVRVDALVLASTPVRQCRIGTCVMSRE